MLPRKISISEDPGTIQTAPVWAAVGEEKATWSILFLKMGSDVMVALKNLSDVGR